MLSPFGSISVGCPAHDIEDGDVGDHDPIHINYYTVETGKEPEFTRYLLAFNSIVALGLPCEIVNLDGDGDQDIVAGSLTGQY